MNIENFINVLFHCTLALVFKFFFRNTGRRDTGVFAIHAHVRDFNSPKVSVFYTF